MSSTGEIDLIQNEVEFKISTKNASPELAAKFKKFYADSNTREFYCVTSNVNFLFFIFCLNMNLF